jgi:hypothetical protein
MDSQSAAAVVTQRPHITTAELISLDHLADRFDKFYSLIRNLDPIDTSRVVKPIEMRVEPEYCRAVNGLVTAHAFEDAATVVQRMRGDVRIGFTPGDNIAVPPYPSGLIKCHRLTSMSTYCALRLRIRFAPLREIVGSSSRKGAPSKTERR